MEEKEEVRKNIFQKLIEVRKSCPYLQKAHKGYQFTYVSSSQTLSALRKAMDEEGLLLVPEVQQHVLHKKGDTAKEHLTELEVIFTWINAEDPEERIVCPWYAQGLDTGEKGVGKALTYAEKYFLLKFFNIATDEDDPDRFQERVQSEESVDFTKISKNLLGQIPGIRGEAELKNWYKKHDAEIENLPEEMRREIIDSCVQRKEELLKETGEVK